MTLTRIVPRRNRVSDEALAASLKAIRDGFCDWLFNAPGKGHFLDDDPRIRWVYAQMLGPPAAVLIELRPA